MNNKLWRIIILVQASLAMLGSLYFSNFGDPLVGLFSGTGFDPCSLCRWARILMYPIIYLAIYALWRKDDMIAYLTGGVGTLGMLLMTYLYLLQYQATQNIFNCGTGVDCTIMGWHVGFVTIPLLALIAFTVIALASIVILWRRK